MNLKLIIPLIFIILGVGYLAYVIYSSSQYAPEIIYGQERCDNCGMIISEKKFSAIAYAINEGRWVKFDDIGGLFIYMVKNGGREAFKDIYVFDFISGEQIKATEAYFVRGDSEKIWTPMSSGIIAFKSLDDARKYAEQFDAEVFTFDELYTMVYNRPDMVFQNMVMYIGVIG